MDSDAIHKAGTHSDEPAIPEFVGPYRIECLLEKGGMSLLYLGTHPTTHEAIAVKVLSPKYLSKPDVVQRFLNEAEIISLTDHPNIIKLHGHGTWEGGLYIAMEFVQGISLRQLILKNPLSLNKALAILVDIAYALCHFHTHGVIHRDLKPENILITEQGTIKVIDFGIAQLLTEQETLLSQPTQRLIGTPVYMSPEQRENPEMVSYPTDVYSLGIIAYELILGKLSHGKVHLSLMPRGMQKILHKALQPKPSERYQDVVDFITDVTGYMSSPSIEKEKNAANLFGEISENLHTIQRSLAPLTPPAWPHSDIGIAIHQGFDLSGIYCDFFELDGGKYGVLLAAPFAAGSQGIIHAALLRGAARALHRREETPSNLAAALNTLLVNDPIKPTCRFVYLTLDPKKHAYHCISCGGGVLWCLAADGSANKVTIDNAALGIDANTPFVEKTNAWKPGDTLLLGTYTMRENDTFLDRGIFEKALAYSESRSTQELVNYLIRRLRALSTPKRDQPICLIGLSRRPPF